MPSNMSNSPPTADNLPGVAYFQTASEKASWAGQIDDAMMATEAIVIANAAKHASLGLRKQINVEDIGGIGNGVRPNRTPAENTFIFNSTAVNETGPCDWVFPQPFYPSLGFAITHKYQRFVSGAGWGGTVIDMQANTGHCLSFIGDGVSYDSRLRGGGIIGIKTTNSGGTTGSALYIRHATHMLFERWWTDGFRGFGGQLNSSDFADSLFLGCDAEYCGSVDDSDKPAIFMGNINDNALWNNDAHVWLKCRWEVCGDRIFECRQGSGVGANLFVNKIFLIGCKTESADLGGSAGNGAQFYLDNVDSFNVMCHDFTLQDKRVGHAIIPTIFKVVNTSSLHLSTATFNVGSGTKPQCFTNFFNFTGGDSLLSLNDVWINSGNAGAIPAPPGFLPLKATNTPRLSQRGCGFKGTFGQSKVASDWFIGAEWRGIHAGAPSAGGVIA